MTETLNEEQSETSSPPRDGHHATDCSTEIFNGGFARRMSIGIFILAHRSANGIIENRFIEGEQLGMKTLLKVRLTRAAGKLRHTLLTQGNSVRRTLGISSLTRPAAVLVLTALLAPLVFFGQSARISAHSASPVINPIPPLPAAAPPEAFASVSSEPNFPAALASVFSSSVVAASDKLAGGYESAANFIAPPAPPAGFDNAVLPSIGDRVSSALSSLAKKKSAAADTAETEIETSIEPPAPAAPPPAPLAPGTTNFDFDGDGKADVARFQQSSNQWKIKNSNGGSLTTSTLGTAGSIIAPADYDGDGKTDRAVFNQNTGNWTIKRSSDGATQTISAFGLSGDKPVAGDYDGDGAADAALWRPSSGTWYIRRSSDGQFTSTVWGQSGDIPVPGNYDGSGGLDLAVFRPSNGTWYVLLPGNGGSYTYFQWGANGDVPVPASYDNDSKTDFAVFRPANGTWYVNRSDGGSYIGKTWGNYGDQPVPADYDGDGKADFAVWRPTSGVWYLVKSSDATLNTYAYEQLGIPNDVAVPSAYVKQIGGQVLSYDLANARLSPKNATGGTDLYSRNFSWGTSLVGLSGRAGLDAGFGISYNSLVWTKEPTSNTMVFDADHSNISPGFRFGFPTIEPSYYNGLTQQFSYLMVTPSGARVEFRQNAASGVYETADSSYAQLTVVAPSGTGGPRQPTPGAEDLKLIVRTTDGTQMTYVWRAGAYRLLEIKDRNGNFITVVYDADYGLLRSMTDTLGRIVTIEYDSDFYPTAIKQDWKDNNGAGPGIVSHTYATFTYTAKQINPNFNPLLNMNIFGPSNGAYVKVLEQIVYPTGGRTVFEYNDYGQVKKVRNLAADQHELNYVRTDLDNAASTTQDDCPRFSTTYNYAENFNNNQPTVIHNTFTSNATYTAGGESLAPTDVVEAYLDGDPHAVHSKTYYYQAGNWAEGLPLGTIDSADNAQQRWTRTVWTQDDTTKIYKVNPRVIESKVGDTTNTKRTTIDYLLQPNSNASVYGLTSAVRVYDANQTTVLKKVITDYNLNQTYLDRRIIGLPKEQRLYEGENSLMSMITYSYDGDSFSDASLQQDIPLTIQHDNTNYGASFISGRGNSTSMTRCNTVYSTAGNCVGGIPSSIKYNTTGAEVAQITPGNIPSTTRQISLIYADAFNDTQQPRNTYAYPTKLTDPAGNFSTIQYRFDIGANVWAKSPVPDGNSFGKETKRVFDSFGRLERESLLKNGDGTEYAYKRYDYSQPDWNTHSKAFSTITDTNGNGIGDVADELATENWTDGAGRVYKSRSPLSFNTNGNAITWAGQLIEYNILGQVSRRSIPAEVNNGWQLIGDDAVRGNWLWTSQKYDWKGRVTRKINTDGVDSPTLNASDVLISYEGCGCAGGQVTTVQGELVPRDDQPNTNARRTQKVYEDIQGRAWKTQLMKWDGVTPYATVINVFNGRDQSISVKQYDGAETSSSFQETTMSYDGFGRLASQHRPEQQNSDGSPAYSTYNYNPDDSIQSSVDARGATTSNTYNSRGLLEQISYSVPTNSGIQVPSNIIYGYDAVGNRISMTDGLGNVQYEYNQFSQMTTETKQFNDALPNAPMANNKFKLEYTYGLSGKLLSYKDPYGQQVNYTQDKVGRLSAVTGSSFGGVTNYASNSQYRAWGSLKSLSYGDQTQMQMTYDNRLQASTFKVIDSTQSDVIRKSYDYYADGHLRYSQDITDGTFDRLNIYDQTGRIKYGKSGGEARGETVVSPSVDLPYRQSYTSDVFGNITQRTNLHWGRSFYPGQGSFNLNYTFLNNRITNAGWGYDADGRVTQSATPDPSVQSIFDAAGNLIALHRTNSSTNRYSDGNGHETKREQGSCTVVPGQPCQQWGTDLETKYFLRSSVLNEEVVTEITFNGKKSKTFIMAAGTTIARQEIYDGNGGAINEVVYFQHDDASGMTQRTINSNGTTIYDEGEETSPGESDPLGGNVGITNPYPNPQPPHSGNPDGGGIRGPQGSGDGDENHVNGQAVTYTIDGMEVPRQLATSLLRSGGIELSGHNDPFLLGNLGIMPIYSSRPSNHDHPDNDSDTIHVYTDEDRYISGYTIYDMGWDLQQQSANMRDFGNAVQAVRDILGQKGPNPCADFFGGAGLDALDNIVKRVTDQAENKTFQNLGNTSTGISQNIPYQSNVGDVGIPMNTQRGLDGTESPVRNYVAISPNSFAINTAGAFVSGFASRIGGYANRSLQSRVVQILHEIGHLVITNTTPTLRIVDNKIYKQVVSTPLLPVDGTDPDLSKKNTDGVLKACGDQIKALK